MNEDSDAVLKEIRERRARLRERIYALELRGGSSIERIALLRDHQELVAAEAAMLNYRRHHP